MSKKNSFNFEFTPKLNQLASKKGFLIFHDIQIIPTSFALDLKREGLIKKFKGNQSIEKFDKTRDRIDQKCNQNNLSFKVCERLHGIKSWKT